MSASAYYVGLMSGTSVDGIDVALVDIKADKLAVIDYQTIHYSAELAQNIHQLCRPGNDEISRLGKLDRQIGWAFRGAVEKILTDNEVTHSQIQAIGSHGQTVRHHPAGVDGFSLQLGDANTIATLGIDVVADFRKRDIALGGQGAPLVPAFHHAMFADSSVSRAVLNIGGISNVTLLPADERSITGWDIGPGNTLLDAWCLQHSGRSYDAAGRWASTGQVDTGLLTSMMADPYFAKATPKSTGREYFNLEWLSGYLQQTSQTLPPEDIQATLLALTAHSIEQAINPLNVRELLVCGGGCHNLALMDTLARLLPKHKVTSTERLGLSPDCVEAVAFAWLAHAFIQGIPGNLPGVTGASKPAVLGALYPAS